MRMNWVHGASRLLSIDYLLSMFILPLLLLFASINVQCSMVSGILFVALFLIVYKNYSKLLPKFFFAWMNVSIILLYVIFEFIVISFLQIHMQENTVLSICLLIFIMFAYNARIEAKKLRETLCNVDKSTDKHHYCNVCQMFVPSSSQHRYWIDACILPANIKYYTTSLLFALITLLYSSNLCLTTICRPFSFYYSILLPEDCSESYEMIEVSLPFVSALYSLMLAVLASWEFIFGVKGIVCGMIATTKVGSTSKI